MVTKNNKANAPAAAAKTTTPALPIARWLATTSSAVGKHALHLMTESAGARTQVVDEILAVLRSHYVAPATAAQRLSELGAPKTAKLLREHLPTTKTARSGDLGEVFATEVAEHTLKFTVPVRRLRWKDGRNMALRGDDIVGLRHDAKGKLEFLKGESKSRGSLKTADLNEAGAALDRDGGRPSRHSVLFVADRLRDSAANDPLAARLEKAVLDSFAGTPVEHFLFTLTGSDPANLLTVHLKDCAKRKRLRHAVGVQVDDHGALIAQLFKGL